MSCILDRQKLAAEVQDAVAKVAIVSILPILSMCSDTIRANDGMGGGKAFGFMTGLAFHQREEAEIDTNEFLHGLGQAFGERMRIERGDIESAETALDYFLEGLERGFRQPVTDKAPASEVPA